MSAKVGILIVHGMGDHESNYAEKFVKQVRKKLRRLDVDEADVAIEPCFWQSIVKPTQDARWQDMEQGATMRWKGLRQFVVGAFGDVLAYQGIPPANPSPFYGQIHERVAHHLRVLEGKLDPSGPKPLIVAGFSFGTTIMSNYIWDARKTAGQRTSPSFEHCDTICGFMTMGSTIPLFTLHIEKREDIHSISLGDSMLPPNFPREWVNFYDPDDVLGYPLKPISDSFNAAVAVDKKVNVGNLLTFWNPFSHLGYRNGRNGEVTHRIAEFSKKVVVSVNKL